MIMMCQSRFIFGEKCTILVSDVDNGGSCVCAGSRRISSLSFKFYCKPKAALIYKGFEETFSCKWFMVDKSI